MAEKVDKARVAFKCSGCLEVCPTEKEFKHKEDCKKKSVKKCCTHNGTFPHGGTPPKK